MKIAVLSNINIDPVVRILNGMEGIDAYQTVGYGNELGLLLNKESPLYNFSPQEVYLVMDLMEVIQHDVSVEGARVKITEWFANFESGRQEGITYYISNAYLYGPEVSVLADKNVRWEIESIWQESASQVSIKYSNVRIFCYREIVESLGEKQAFSSKMWYMGKILHTTDFHKELARRVSHQVDVDSRICKKVLLLDLDNTLWGGVAGEDNNNPIKLSDDKIGLSYKNFQRVIKQVGKTGVILGIVSKNNSDDALHIINNHPHMVLCEEDFSIKMINWENKPDNIVQIARELNVGTDSFVFIDDNPAERQFVREALPEVVCPDFPNNPEELPAFMVEVYHDFFEKPAVTAEDMDKANQYKANGERNAFLAKSSDFNSYLEGLGMKLIRVNPVKYKERLEQLMNKTNQFNLTTKRFTSEEIAGLLDDESSDVFLYRVTDKFGDNGIVAAAIVSYDDEAVISEFTMSCRVMGRHIENAIIEDIENAAREQGYKTLTGIYIPTEKNKPVSDLYPSLDYLMKNESESGEVKYVIDLTEPLQRDYRLARESEDE